VAGEAVGDGDSPADQILELPIGRVSAHHNDSARPVTYGDNLDRDLLRREVHHQRRQHVSGVDLAGNERLFDLRPTVVSFVFEVGSRGASVEIARLAGDGKREVAGNGQPGYYQCLEPVARAKAVAERSPVDVEPPMEGADPGQPGRRSEEHATRSIHTDFRFAES